MLTQDHFRQLAHAAIREAVNAIGDEFDDYLDDAKPLTLDALHDAIESACGMARQDYDDNVGHWTRNPMINRSLWATLADRWLPRHVTPYLGREPLDFAAMETGGSVVYFAWLGIGFAVPFTYRS